MHFDSTASFLSFFIKRTASILINFPSELDHLWYVYMILGLYLFIPVLSPWVERASRQEMRIFLIIWIISLTVPFLKLIWPELWGDCFWNPNNTVYYFSGFIGFLVSGAYAHKYLYDSGKSYIGVGIVLLIIGYIYSLQGYLYQVNNYPLPATNVLAFFTDLHIAWNSTTITIGLQTLGIFLILISLKVNKLPSVVTDFSRLSYGIYLCHIIILMFFYDHIFVSLEWSTPVKILCMGALTICASYLVMKILSNIPKVKDVVN